MKILTYVVFYDIGFAPNPYFGYCTLATCKPIIRKSAEIGDWVMGTASTRFFPNEQRLLFAMKVTEKLTFNEYWDSPKFERKKPVMNSSLKSTFGDNIYYFDEDSETWAQADSRHSLENGEINEIHLRRDTMSDNVLISDHFYYFGDSSILIPEKLSNYFSKTQGQKYIRCEIEISEVIEWLESQVTGTGIHGFPIQARNKNEFERLPK